MKKTVLKLSQMNDRSLVEDNHAREIGLIDEEYERLKRLLNRLPTKVELGIVAALWSEHCSYKSTKAHLSRLPSTGKHVLVGPGENAGAIDIGDNLAVVFKIESHNHPSFIEPFHGAATGVGGILRDIFTLGARPFAVANFLRFGEVSHGKTSHLLHGVISGIANYGNCFGVPNVLSNIDFHKSYQGNILVNVFAIGVVEHSSIFLAHAHGVKNRLIYVGAKTGRDGIMGAVMASDSFTDASINMRPTIQVGDPFMGKLLLEACMKAFEEKLVVGIQDMGAAGLTSSSFEMASKSSTGLHINLDLVPVRDDTMSAYDIMLSESQERMLMVARPQDVPRLKELFADVDLDCVDIGSVSGDGMVKITFRGEEVVNLSASLITENAPRYRRVYLNENPANPSLLHHKPKVSIEGVFKSFAIDVAQRDKSFITKQFDHHIGLNTIVGPEESDAAFIRVPNTNKAVALALVGNAELARINAEEAAKEAIYQAVLQVSCQGARPIGITNCLNFGGPENIGVMTDIKYTIDGMSQAASHFGIPIISGNVSLYNETNQQAILPTLALALVGLSDNPQNYSKYAHAKESDVIMVMGDIPDDYTGCEAILSDDSSTMGLRVTDPEAIRHMMSILQVVIKEGIVHTTSVVGKGGLIHALIKVMARSKMGASLDFGSEWLQDEVSLGLMSQSSHQVLLAVKNEHVDRLAHLCANKVPLYRYGQLGGNDLVIRHNGLDLYNKPYQEITNHYDHHLGEIFANQ